MIGILTYPRGLNLPLTDADIRLKERLGTLKDYIKGYVGAIYTGQGDSARYFNKQGEFTIAAKAVKVENYWTNFATSTSVSVACVTATASNTLLVACISSSTNYAFSAPKFNGVAMPYTWEAHTTASSAYLAAMLSPAIGSYNFTASIAAAVEWRAVVYQLSGVNQTTIYTDVQGGISVKSATLATVFGGITIDVVGTDPTYSPTPQNGQTPIAVNSINTSGYIAIPTTPTQICSYITSSHYCMEAIAINPA